MTAPDASVPEHAPPSSESPSPEAAPARGYLERAQGLSLVGWACDRAPGAGNERFALVCNGRVEPDVGVIRLEREDVRQALGGTRLIVGFELELPPGLWADGVEQVELSVLVDGKPLPGDRVRLGRDVLFVQARHLRQAWPRLAEASQSERADAQYQLLQLIEHLGAAGPGRFASWPLDLVEFLREQAGRFQVAEVLEPQADEVGQGGAVGQALKAAFDAQDLETVFVWRLMRDFNAGLAGDAGAADPAALLERLLAEHVVDDEVVHRVLQGLIPFFCERGEYARIRGRLDIARLRQLSAATQAHELSLLLPELVSSGDFTQATHVTRRLADRCPGWLNTECVIEAVRLFTRGHHPGAPLPADADQWLLALLDLFADQGLLYWSRAQDRHLLGAMVLLLRRAPGLPVALGWRFQAAVAQSFALVPAFWAQLDREVSADEPWPADIADLGAEVQWLFDRLRHGGPLALSDLSDALPLLLRLRAGGNRDADIVLREMVQGVIPALAAATPAQRRATYAALQAIAPAEVLRLAAHPLADETLLADAPALRERVRRVSGVPTLGGLAAWAQARRLVEQLARDLSGGGLGPAGVEARLEPIFLLSQQLSTADARHAGALILVDAIAIAAPVLAPAELGGWFSRLRRLWRLATEGRDPKALPGAVEFGVWQALARLAASGCTHGDLPQLLREVHRPMARWMGRDLDEALALARAPAGADAGAGAALRVGTRAPGLNTLVVVYACRANLASRVEHIRRTWGADLTRAGVPWVVLVGDGDDRLHGDVLALDVSDTYEDLPAKTLALVRWVVAHTDVDQLFKIDDDCHLAVDAFLHESLHPLQHYVGRRLTRQVGDTDRRWHKGRSARRSADHAIDKSPEPAVYADGGAGYSLSRVAMVELVRALATVEGSRLTRGAYMEDKLLGDLLARRGIEVSELGHETLIRRRFGPGAVPVNAWHSSFLPGPDSPTIVSHLDDAGQLPAVQQAQQGRVLRPARLWPTWQTPDLAYLHDVNQLELLSPEAGVRALADAPVIVVAVARNERTLLPHFLAHYRGLGARHFVLVDNLSDDGSREYLLAQPDVVLYSSDTYYRGSHFGVAWQQAVLGAHALGKWVVLADIDEFLVYDDMETRPLPTWVAALQAEGAEAALTLMVDMYPEGSMAEADLNAPGAQPFAVCNRFDARPLDLWRLGGGPFSNSRTWVSALRHRTIPDSPPNSYTSQKVAVFRHLPWMRLTEGLHYASELQLAARPAFFAHFKYHSGFRDKVLIEVARKQHFNNAEEYVKYSRLLSEARATLSEPGLSAAWTGSRSFSDLALAHPGRVG